MCRRVLLDMRSLSRPFKNGLERRLTLTLPVIAADGSGMPFRPGEVPRQKCNGLSSF